MITTIIGYLGLAFGLGVAPPQIIKILKTKNVTGVSKLTYWLLCACLVCYFIHAVAIGATVFIISNGINMFINFFTLYLIHKYEVN